MNLLVVTGAGASTAFGDGRSLPLMNQWVNSLCDHLDSKENRLAEFCGLRDADTGPVFEETLGRLLRWEASLDVLEQFQSLTGEQPGHHGYDFPASIQRAKLRASTIREALNESLYAEFGSARVNARTAAQGWEQLLATVGAARQIESLSFATTNYDLSIEIALERMRRKPANGMQGPFGRAPVLSAEGLVDACDGSEEIPVIHLHGAVGWYRAETGVHQHAGDLPFNASLGTPVVLYPDPDKDAASDAAVSVLWNEFATALEWASHVLVLGHSMHDAPIVRRLNDARETRVAVVAPADAIDELTSRLQREAPELEVFEGSLSAEPRLDAEALAEWSRTRVF